MDLGERIEYGIRQMEICILCRRNVAMGETLKPFHCGHVVHAYCEREELKRRRKLKKEAREKVEKARKRKENGEEVDEQELIEEEVDMTIVCDCTHTISRLNTRLRIPEPPPLPEVRPHIGFPAGLRKLCGFCPMGSNDFDKMVHPSCGLVFCKSCLELAIRTMTRTCEECGESLSTCQPLRIDPRELEDLLHQPRD